MFPVYKISAVVGGIIKIFYSLTKPPTKPPMIRLTSYRILLIFFEELEGYVFKLPLYAKRCGTAYIPRMSDLDGDVFLAQVDADGTFTQPPSPAAFLSSAVLSKCIADPSANLPPGMIRTVQNSTSLKFPSTSSVNISSRPFGLPSVRRPSPSSRPHKNQPEYRV